MPDGMSFAWEGLRAFEESIARIADEADRAARQIVVQAAALAEAKAKANFQGTRRRVKGPRGGRAYDPRQHVGGDKPNVITGALRRSIRHDPVSRHGFADYGTTVSPRTVYARRVELGYRGSTGYPYFTPAAREAQPEIDALATRTWRRFLNP